MKNATNLFTAIFCLIGAVVFVILGLRDTGSKSPWAFFVIAALALISAIVNITSIVRNKD